MALGIEARCCFAYRLAALEGPDLNPLSQNNDAKREATRRALALGQLEQLTFAEAVKFHDRGGLVAIDIHLRSSARLPIVRLRWEEAQMIVEKRMDQIASSYGRRTDLAPSTTT